MREKLYLWGNVLPKDLPAPTPEDWFGRLSTASLEDEARRLGLRGVLYVNSVNLRQFLHPAYLERIVAFSSILTLCKKQFLESAEDVARLAGDFPGIEGAFADDLFILIKDGRLTLDDVCQARDALAKGPRRLFLAAVVYEHELESWQPEYDAVAELVDVFTFWIWDNLQHSRRIDEYIEAARRRFPGKPVLWGIYLHDYIQRIAMPEELLRWQFTRAAHMIAAGLLDGAIITASQWFDLPEYRLRSEWAAQLLIRPTVQ